PSFLAAAAIDSHSGAAGAARAIRLAGARSPAAPAPATPRSRSRREMLRSFATLKSSLEGFTRLTRPPGRDYLTRTVKRSTERILTTHAGSKAPLSYVGQAAVETDIANFKAALAGLSVTETFLPAVAPGTIEHWLRNAHYPSDEAYLAAIAEAMKVEYDAVVRAGFVLQIDDPDLADAWQIHPTMTVAEYRKFAALRIEALNHALRDIPPERVRFHVCWGSYHGPHKHDLPLRDLVDLVLAVR